MRAPVVSVIIPTYNCTEFLPQAVRSVLDQGLPEEQVELIVVDDGSKDDVRSALAQFGTAVTYVRQDNAGVSAARNRGVLASHAAYVAFLDADDYWLPGCLPAMLALAREHSKAFVTVNLYYETNGTRAGQTLFERNDLHAFFDWPAEKQYPRALEGGLFSYMTLMHHALFEQMGGFNRELCYGEDYDLSLRCLSRGIPVRGVKEPLAVYRYLRPGAATTIWSAARIASQLRMLEPHRRFVPRQRWRSLSNRLVYYQFREAMQRRSWLSLLISAAKLAARPRFCFDVLRAHGIRTQS